jgi:hypothetical protein
MLVSPVGSAKGNATETLEGKLMDERIRFVEHKGKRILLLDFSRATAPQMIPLLTQVQTTVAQQEPKSALVLANFEGAEIDHNVAMKIKEVLTFDRPFVKKSAWLGSEHIPQALSESFHIFTQREPATFRTREAALDWLVRE